MFRFAAYCDSESGSDGKGGDEVYGLLFGGVGVFAIAGGAAYGMLPSADRGNGSSVSAGQEGAKPEGDYDCRCAQGAGVCSGLHRQVAFGTSEGISAEAERFRLLLRYSVQQRHDDRSGDEACQRRGFS